MENDIIVVSKHCHIFPSIKNNAKLKNKKEKCRTILAESGVEEWMPQMLRLFCNHCPSSHQLTAGFVIFLLIRITENQLILDFGQTLSIYECQTSF